MDGFDQDCPAAKTCVSSVKITGNRCEIQFKDKTDNEQCVLNEGEYNFYLDTPPTTCVNDVVTQYTVLEGPRGRLLM